MQKVWKMIASNFLKLKIFSVKYDAISDTFIFAIKKKSASALKKLLYICYAVMRIIAHHTVTNYFTQDLISNSFNN